MSFAVKSQSINWVSQYGSTQTDIVSDIELDSKGNLYSVGYFRDTMDIANASSSSTYIAQGSLDGFISKTDVSGNVVWIKHFGGLQSTAYAISIAVSSQDELLISGYFSGTVDFNPGTGSYPLTSAGGRDPFILKLDTNGNFSWAKTFSGINDNSIESIAVDNSGDIVSTGLFRGTITFDSTSNSSFTTPVHATSLFIHKFSSSGNQLWVKTINTSNTEIGRSIAIDKNNNIYITGEFHGTTDFDPGVLSYQLSANNRDCFILKLNTSGNFVWATSFGSNAIERGNCIKVDYANNVYTIGTFGNLTDFDPGTGTFQLAATASFDVFIQKLDSNGNFLYAKAINQPRNSRLGAFDLSISSKQKVSIVGHFRGTIDFDPDTAVVNRQSTGGSTNFNSFILSLDSMGSFDKVYKITSPYSVTSMAIKEINDDYLVGGYFEGTLSLNQYSLNSRGGADGFTFRLSNSTILTSDKSMETQLNTVSIYPNPTNGLIHIDHPYFLSGKIEVLNKLGQLIIQKEIKQKHSTISFEGKNGLYFIKLIPDNGIQTVHKVIKKD